MVTSRLAAASGSHRSPVDPLLDETFARRLQSSATLMFAGNIRNNTTSLRPAHQLQVASGQIRKIRVEHSLLYCGLNSIACAPPNTPDEPTVSALLLRSLPGRPFGTSQILAAGQQSWLSRAGIDWRPFRQISRRPASALHPCRTQLSRHCCPREKTCSESATCGLDAAQGELVVAWRNTLDGGRETSVCGSGRKTAGIGGPGLTNLGLRPPALANDPPLSSIDHWRPRLALLTPRRCREALSGATAGSVPKAPGRDERAATSTRALPLPCP
jgi:hypothetical protein